MSGKRQFEKMIDEVVPLAGAHGLVAELKTRGHAVVLVKAALAEAGIDDAVLVGDTPWDVEAARKAGLGTIAVLAGGAYSEAELRDSGAVAVFESVGELRDHLDETPLS